MNRSFEITHETSRGTKGDSAPLSQELQVSDAPCVESKVSEAGSKSELVKQAVEATRQEGIEAAGFLSYCRKEWSSWGLEKLDKITQRKENSMSINQVRPNS
jgi:hypothetical protein